MTYSLRGLGDSFYCSKCQTRHVIYKDGRTVGSVLHMVDCSNDEVVEWKLSSGPTANRQYKQGDYYRIRFDMNEWVTIKEETWTKARVFSVVGPSIKD